MVLDLMAKVYNRVHGILRREEGQGMVEYGLILALVAVVVIAVLTAIGGDLVTKFKEVGKAINPSNTAYN